VGWSANSQELALLRERGETPGKPYDLYVMNMNTRTEARVASNVGITLWSPWRN
jgi:hypothetical protein